MGASGLRKQLEEAQTKNAELLEKKLKAEEMAQSIPSMKREMDACKEALAQSELKYSELQLLTKDKQQIIDQLQEECEMMRQSELQATREHAALQLDLQQMSEIDQDVQQSDLATGLTELNPDVKEKLERLESENERLKNQQSAQGEDNLRKLQLSIENLERVKSILEEKLHESKAKCAGLEENLAQKIAVLGETEASLEAKTELCKELDAKLEIAMEDISKLENEREDLQQMVANLQAKLEDTESLLEETRERAEESALQKENEHASAVEELRREHEGLIEEKLQSLEGLRESMRLREQEHEEALAAEITRGFAREFTTNIINQSLHSILLQEFEAYKSTHNVSVSHFENLVAEWESKHGQVSNDLEAKSSELGETQQALQGLEAKIKEGKGILRRKLDELETQRAKIAEITNQYEAQVEATQRARETTTRLQSTVDQQQAQILSLRRQYKSLQLQRSQSSARESDDSQQQLGELRAEINRLSEEVSTLSEENRVLKARPGGSGSSTSRYGEDAGLAELVRNYEAQICVIEEEKKTLSLAKANELTLRHKLEHKSNKLSRENDELKAQVISLQLKLERSSTEEEVVKSKTTKAHRTPSRRSSNEENRGSGAVNHAPPAILQSVKDQDGTQPTQSPSKCNQQ